MISNNLVWKLKLSMWALINWVIYPLEYYIALTDTNWFVTRSKLLQSSLGARISDDYTRNSWHSTCTPSYPASSLSTKCLIQFLITARSYAGCISCLNSTSRTLTQADITLGYLIKQSSLGILGTTTLTQYLVRPYAGNGLCSTGISLINLSQNMA